MSWQDTWRRGIAPQLPTGGLEALAEALESDDPRLLQGATTSPPPLACVQTWPAEGTDAVGFALWQGEPGWTVADLEEAWARAVFVCEQALGVPAACRWFLNWYDETPRDEMRRLLLAEVRQTLAERQHDPAAHLPGYLRERFALDHPEAYDPGIPV